jgi:hypothetical protein
MVASTSPLLVTTTVKDVLFNLPSVTMEETAPRVITFNHAQSLTVLMLNHLLAVVLLLLKQELKLTLLQLNLEEEVCTLKDLFLLEVSLP